MTVPDSNIWKCVYNSLILEEKEQAAEKLAQLQQMNDENDKGVPSLLGSKRSMVFEEEVESKLREDDALLFKGVKVQKISTKHSLAPTIEGSVLPINSFEEEIHGLIFYSMPKKRILDDWSLVRAKNSNSFCISTISWY